MKSNVEIWHFEVVKFVLFSCSEESLRRSRPTYLEKGVVENKDRRIKTISVKKESVQLIDTEKMSRV
jgi:hypothetical protein